MPEKTTASDGLTVYLRLLSYVKPYWGFFVISLTGYLVFAISQPAFVRLLQYFIEALERNNETLVRDFGNLLPSDWLHSVGLIPVLLIVVAIVRGLGSFAGGYWLAKVSHSVVHDIRCQMFDRLLKLPNEFYTNANTGHLVARFAYNVNQVSQAATNAIQVFLREGLTAICLLGFLIYSNWQLTLIFVTTAPVIGLVVSYASRRFRRLSHRTQASMGELTHISNESINSYRVIKGYGGERRTRQRFQQASAHNRRQNLKMLKAAASHTPVIQLIISLALSLILYATLWLNDGTSTAALISFITAATLLPKPIRQLSEINVTVQNGIAAAESVFAIIDQPTERDIGTIEKDRVEGKLEFRNVSFRYPSSTQPALDGVNLVIQPGETVALVGRSGSGKTTLANLIPRFCNHDSGDILLDDVPVVDYTLSNLRSHIALVDQQIALFNDTVAKNVAFGNLGLSSDEEVRQAVQVAHAEEFVNKLSKGIHTLVGENGVQLSGGQRQRLAIARAVLKNSPILLLDEATSALDTESERHIQAALEEITRDRTTLVIAHRLSTIENADRIAVLDNGKIIETGTHQELLNLNGHYAKLHRMQFADV